jgi:hypothetical protein
MKIPFTDREILAVRSDKDRLLATIKNHTNADDRNFERMFVGQVDGNGFEIVRIKKFGLWDYCLTSLHGLVKNNEGRTELHLTYKLRLWYALEMPILVFLFTSFVTIAALSDKANGDDVFIIAGIGVIALTWTSLRYKRRYETDKEKYKTLLDQMIYQSNVR